MHVSGKLEVIKMTMTAMDIVLGMSLIISVILMKNAVISTNYAQPNQKLVDIHVINFTVLILVSIMNTILSVSHFLQPATESSSNV